MMNARDTLHAKIDSVSIHVLMMIHVQKMLFVKLSIIPLFVLVLMVT